MKNKVMLKTASYILIFAMIITSLAGSNVTYVSAAQKATLSTKSFSLYVGNKKTLVIANKNQKATYTFYSSKSTIASVSKSGLITGKKIGSSTITVKEKLSGKTATTIGSLKVTVKAQPNAYLAVRSVSLYENSSSTIQIKYKKSKAAYSFSSYRTSVATVSKTGKIVAKKAGTTTITVKEKISGKKTRLVGYLRVTVKVQPKASLSVLSISLYENKSTTIQIKYKKSKAAYSFSSYRTSVATVSKTGKIVAKKAGTTTITVKEKISGKKTRLVGYLRVTVKVQPKASLSVRSISLYENKSTTIQIKYKKQAATYSFSSSNTSIATASSTGKIIGKKAGTATITVKEKVSGKTAILVGTIKVTVKAVATPTPAPTAEPTVAPTVEPTIAPTAEPTTAPTVAPINEKFQELVRPDMESYSATEKGLVFDNTNGTAWTKQYDNIVRLPIPADIETGFTSLVFDITCYDASGNEIKYTDSQVYSGPISSYVVASSKDLPESGSYADVYTEAIWNHILNGVSVLTLNASTTADFSDGTGFVPIEMKDNDTIKKIVIHSVRFSGYPGYELPKATDHSESTGGTTSPEDVDVSAFYDTMIDDSLVSTGNNSRIKSAIAKAQSGEDVTIAYIGGSITEGEGASPNSNCYAEQSYLAFKEKFGKDDGSNVHFVNAGMCGTPSSLGQIRYQRDIVNQGFSKPDILFIEFAVNDSGECTGGEAYESMIRDAIESGSAVVLMFSVFKSKWNLQSTYEPIGTYYDLPMISMKDALVPQWSKGIPTWFFNDDLHPNNYGYKLMSDCILNLYDTISSEEVDTDDYDMTKKAPFKGDSYSGIQMLDSTVDLANLPTGITSLSVGGFSQKDGSTGTFYYKDKDGKTRSKFPDNWMHTAASGSESFKATVSCSNMMIVYKLSNDSNFGTAEILVDGEVVKTMNSYNTDGWNNATTELVFKDTKIATHNVEIRMAAGNENKSFTVLALGYTPTVSSFAGQSNEPVLDVNGADEENALNVPVTTAMTTPSWTGSATIAQYVGPNSEGIQLSMSGQYGQANITFSEDIDLSQYSKIVIKCKATEGTYAVKLLTAADENSGQGFATQWGVTDTITIDASSMDQALNRIGFCSTNDGSASVVITKISFIK